MTSSVQSHLPSERCLYTRQWPLQEHAFSEDFGVVAGGERSGWSHACTHPLDVSALSIEAPPHASLSVETSAHASLSVETSARTPDWDVGAASGVATRVPGAHERGGAAAPLRSTNHAHCFAEAIVTRAAGLHRRHARTKSHSAPDSGNGLLGAGKSLAAWWASRHHPAMVLQCWPPAPSSSSHGPCAGHGPMTPATACAIIAPFLARRTRVSPASTS